MAAAGAAPAPATILRLLTGSAWCPPLCVLGVSDLMFMTRSVAGIYYKGTECYLIAATVYLFLTYLSSLLLKAITGKMTAPDNTKRHQGNQTVDLGLPSSN